MKHTEKLFIGIALGGAILFATQFTDTSKSADLVAVSATLSNSRLSFFGTLAATNALNSTSVTINTGVGPSSSTNQLQPGDSVRIGDSNSMGAYTVVSTTPDSVFTTSTGLLNGNYDSGDAVVSTQSANLTVAFQTINAITDGSFRVLIPARATGGNDGLPDGGGFDFGAGSSLSTVTCPSDANNYTFSAGVATPNAITINGTLYHSYVCEYTGTPSIPNRNFSGTGNTITISGLINPAAKTVAFGGSTHTAGTADTYRVIVQHLDSADVTVDQTAVSIGVIEAVKVTAEVPPQISFSIAGVNTGTSTCGDTTGATSTATTVPFGELVIATPRVAAQTLSVSTNATGGYAVTAAQSNQLGQAGANCTGDPPSSTSQCIVDAAGDNTTMSHSNTDEWSSASVYGFGFTMDTTAGTPTTTFEYDSNGVGSCDGTGDCYRQFADLDGNPSSPLQAPQQIFGYNTVTNPQSVNVCYKVNVSATQEAGTYENYVTYRATATF